MNAEWETFLSSRQDLIDTSTAPPLTAGHSVNEKSLSPLTHLGVLKVSGKDAAKLLQGQITCNVNDISETSSRIAAMCNPKGRAIATFLVVKKADFFLLVVPTDLSDTVKTKLKLYVLRSDVKIEEASDEYCIMGLSEHLPGSDSFVTEHLQNAIFVNLPESSARKLVITDVDNAIQHWIRFADSEGYRAASPAEWRYLDIVSGFPWVTAATSEAFIQQMLNLDKLGGISFNKGCYTGQEIIARTHYLGKIKRELWLAECQSAQSPEPNTAVINLDTEGQDVVGTVVQSERVSGKPEYFMLLIVLQIAETSYKTLGLTGDDQARLTLQKITYDR
ncbi:MAG: folate-binding protein YgfZ [Methylococcaceae bacterium]|nr:folate-binding protein YgfZ [Methylococcaceae bacterium]